MNFCDFMIIYIKYSLQVGAWICFSFGITIDDRGDRDNDLCLILFLSLYSGYLLLEFLSPEWRFLCKCKKKKYNK